VKDLGLSGAKFHPGIQRFIPMIGALHPFSRRSLRSVSPHSSIPGPVDWARICRAEAVSSWTIHALSTSIASPPTSRR
jgi:hypothetical protein